ncbi:ATP-dependent DNA ligase [Streptomyces sp. NPDC002287]
MKEANPSGPHPALRADARPGCRVHPQPGVLASGFSAEQKCDGHRTILFTPANAGGRLLLQTGRGSLVQDRFPDLVAAARQLPDGLVLDGERVVWDPATGRLSSEALQRRAAARGCTATALAGQTPASFIAFDALQIDDTELPALPYAERRGRLEVLFAARALTAPETLCPMATDPDQARQWLENWTQVPDVAIEGIVVKRMNQPTGPEYATAPGSRSDAETPAKPSSGPSPEPWPAPSSSSSAATTRPDTSAPSAAPSPCARKRPARSPSSSPRLIPTARGPARASPRPRAPRTSSTPGMTRPRRRDQPLPPPDPVRAPAGGMSVDDVPRFGAGGEGQDSEGGPCRLSGRGRRATRHPYH